MGLKCLESNLLFHPFKINNPHPPYFHRQNFSNLFPRKVTCWNEGEGRVIFFSLLKLQWNEGIWHHPIPTHHHQSHSLVHCIVTFETNRQEDKTWITAAAVNLPFPSIKFMWKQRKISFFNFGQDLINWVDKVPINPMNYCVSKLQSSPDTKRQCVLFTLENIREWKWDVTQKNFCGTGNIISNPPVGLRTYNNNQRPAASIYFRLQ